MCDTRDGPFFGGNNHGPPKRGPGVRDGLLLGEGTRETKAGYLMAHDDTSVTRASGSALCFGNKSGKTCQAILFQNYQNLIGRNKFWENYDVQYFLAGLLRLASFKGGFLLPEDVENAEIVFEDDQPQRWSFTDPTAATKLPSEPPRSVGECL